MCSVRMYGSYLCTSSGTPGRGMVCASRSANGSSSARVLTLRSSIGATAAAAACAEDKPRLVRQIVRSAPIGRASVQADPASAGRHRVPAPHSRARTRRRAHALTLAGPPAQVLHLVVGDDVAVGAL